MKPFLFGSVGLAMVVACGGGGGKEVGTEGGPCYPNNTCNDGLACLSELCVDPSSLLDVISSSDIPDTSLPRPDVVELDFLIDTMGDVYSGVDPVTDPSYPSDRPLTDLWSNSETADSSCIPQCNGKNCGDDGCGGSCGECGAPSCTGLMWMAGDTCISGVCASGGDTHQMAHSTRR